MNTKPALIVVTGRPASGKTTLAKLLCNKIGYAVISRDELKEGYINTIGQNESRDTDITNWHVYTIFFETIELLLSKNVSIIAEAAFQHQLWEPKLLEWRDKATIKIIVCNLPVDIAKERFAKRLLNDPGRQVFHNDGLLQKNDPLLTEAYRSLQMKLPTLQVFTRDEYNPPLTGMIDFIKG